VLVLGRWVILLLYIHSISLVNMNRGKHTCMMVYIHVSEVFDRPHLVIPI
jgi:hypothetical protein